MANSSKINIFLIVVLGILLYILFADKCTSTKTKPVVIKGADVIREVNLIEKERKHLADSFNLITAKYEDDIREKGYSYDELMKEYLTQQEIMEGVFKKPIPDTCREVVAALNKQYTTLKAFSDQKDKSANSLIGSLKDLNEHQKRFLSEKDSAYAKMKTLVDTCAKSLIAMERYSKQLEPKRRILAGLSGMGMYGGNLNPAIGGGVCYQNKKGVQIDAAVYTNKVVTVGIKFPIISF